MNVEQIAQVCHEANRAYCITLGDFSQKVWSEAEPWQQESAIKGVQYRLDAHARGETPPPDAQHNAWLADKERTGWRYGPVKDASKREHPCCVPYQELPVEQRLKDYLFVGIVTAFLHARADATGG